MGNRKLDQLVTRGEKIAALTCYDASFATLCEQAGVDILLVGDSLNMVIKGERSTLSARLIDMQYHTRCVAQGASHTCIVSDMPFGSYQANSEQAWRNAARLMGSGAHMVKIEGGSVMAETINFLCQRGIPVCGHLGLTPQSIHQLGGYRTQGTTEASAQQLLNDAKILVEAGISLLVLEMIPHDLAQQVTDQIAVPTIGIGAGRDCSGQVLVLYDMLGIYPGKIPGFVRNFMQEAGNIQQAIQHYVTAVKNHTFPA